MVEYGRLCIQYYQVSQYIFREDIMQDNVSAKCPRCSRPPSKQIVTNEVFKTYICYDVCGNIYWSLEYCPNCNHPQITYLIQKPNMNKLMRCKKCAYEFYIFRCPNEQCYVLFYKKRSKYIMGIEMQCVTCKCHFKDISCECGGQIFFNASHMFTEGITEFKCQECHKAFYYIICPEQNCYMPNYFKEPLDFGQKIKCEFCKSYRQFAPCPSCGHQTDTKRLKYCSILSCQYCQVTFEYSKCPYGCGVNFTFTDKQLSPIRQCSGACKMVYFLMNCRHCENMVHIDQIEKGVARKEKCPYCRSQLQFYYCPCEKVILNDIKCSNESCPPPKKTVSYTEEYEASKTVAQTESNYDEKICKICYDQDSTMINSECGHLMMCANCTKQVTKNTGEQKGPCPICKTIGSYHKYVVAKWM